MVKSILEGLFRVESFELQHDMYVRCENRSSRGISTVMGSFNVMLL